MKIFLRNSSKNLVRNGGNVYNMKDKLTTTGKGLTKEFYENTDVKKPSEALSSNHNNKNMLSSVKIKSSNPKKYISFNI